MEEVPVKSAKTNVGPSQHAVLLFFNDVIMAMLFSDKM